MLIEPTGNIIGSLLSADVYSRYVSALRCGPPDLKSRVDIAVRTC